MKPQPQPIAKEALLLVEGKDPLNFFEALCNHLSLSRQLQIMNFGGVGELRGFLAGLRGRSGFRNVKSIGIIRDAEKDAAAAFQSVQASLRRIDLEVPNEPEQCSGTQPAVGIMILPGQGRKGMLETMLCETFADAPEYKCIKTFFKCVKESRQGWAAERLDKAWARVFIATQSEPHVSVGIAARKGYWPLDHEVLEPVRTFLKSVAAAAN